MLSNRDLEILLNDHTEEYDFSCTVTYKDQGPGYLDPWLYMQKRKNIWQQIEPTPFSHGKKRIIFCEPLTGDQPTSPFLLMFVAALVKNYEVYFWSGQRKSINETRPVTTPSEFWEKIHTAIPVNEEKVKESLEYQGITAENFIIIDHAAYLEILNRWKRNFDDRNLFSHRENNKIIKELNQQLDLTQINVSRWQELALALLPTRITKIKINPINLHEIRVLLKAFAPEQITVLNATDSWVKSYLYHFNHLRVTLKNFYAEDEFVIPATVQLKELKIVKAKIAKFNKLKGLNGARIKRLELVKCDYIRCNLQLIKGVEELLFNNCKAFEFNISKENNVHFLKIHDCRRIGKFDFTLFPNLKKIVLSGKSGKKFIKIGKSNCIKEILAKMGLDLFPELTKLEQIELEDTSHDTNQSYVLDLSKIRSLKEAAIIQPEDWEIKFPARPIIKKTTLSEPSKASNNKTINAKIDSWDLDGQRYHGNDQIYVNDLATINYLHITHTGFLSYNLVEMPALETLIIEKSRLNKFEINALGLKNLIIRSATVTKHFKLDLNGMTLLKNLFIDIKTNNDVILNLQDCQSLTSLYVKTNKAIMINHVEDCHSLRSCILHSKSPESLRNNLLFNLPKDCQLYMNKPIISPPVDQLDKSYSPETFHLPEPSYFNSPCGISQKQNLALYIILACSCTGATAGLICILIYCLIHNYNPLENSNHSHHPHSPSHSPSASPTPTTDSSFLEESSSSIFSDVGDDDPSGLPTHALILIIFGAATIGILFFLLVYRFRHQLGVNCNTQDNIGNLALDGKTYVGEGNPFFEGKFKFNFYTSGNMDLARVRIDVQNAVKFSNGKLVFFPDLTGIRPLKIKQKPLDKNNTNINELMEGIHCKEDKVLCYFEGIPDKNILYPLPTLQNIEQEDDLLGVYADPVDAVKFFWHPQTQQLYFMLNQDIKISFFQKKIKLFYHIRHDSYYLNKFYSSPDLKKDVLFIQNPNELLPLTFKDKLIAELKSFKPLQFLFDDELSNEHKLHKLVDYIRASDATKLDPNPSDPVDKLIAIIKQQKGVCRHCSEAFFVLCRLIGIPVLGISNQHHMFCVIPYQTVQGVRYQRIDLTLPDPELEDIASNSLTTVFDDLLNNTDFVCQPPEQKPLVPVVANIEEKKAYQDYYEKFKEILIIEELHSLNPILNRSKQIFSPLIVLSPHQPIFAVNKQIINYLNAKGIDSHTRHLFVNSPDDFFDFLIPNKIDKGQIIPSEFKPMETLVAEKDNVGLLVVNWSRFTPAQKASFQSIIDTEPLLSVGNRTLKISKQVIVVGLTQGSLSAGKAFLSRTKCWNLHDDFFRTQLSIKNNEGSSRQEKNKEIEHDPIELDLFHLPSWREHILGPITWKGCQTLLEEGPLLKAIRLNCPLIIYNPTDDDELRVLMHRVSEERKFFHNGEMLRIPDHVVIQSKQKAYTNSLHNIRVYSNLSKDIAECKRIYIGLHNLHELYNQLVIDSKGQAETEGGGLLNKYVPGKDVFYITGGIPQSYWQAMLSHIENHYPEKEFDFLLAPGAAIENVAYSAKQFSPRPIKINELVKSNMNIIASNDPDFAVKLLKNKIENDLVIYVTMKTSFNDLIANIYQDQKNNHLFVYKTQGVLEALKAGRTVILSGEISLGLYYQLLPLFSDKPHIVTNGDRVELSGRLMAVLPERVKHSLPQIDALCEFDIDDYKKELGHFANEKITLILKFYQFAKKLPHRGPGRPPFPSLSYHHLVKLMEELDNNDTLHPHNPIKGLFNYDYPRFSEDQAYLNVIGKYYFRPYDKTPARQNKLNFLLNKYEISNISTLKPYVWTILNCFNGAKLNTILGAYLEDNIENDGYPTLAFSALERLWNACQEIEEQKEKYAKPLQNEKQLLQLETLLDNKKKNVVFLKGEPGVGKTYAIRRLIGKYYEGEEGLLEWLKAENTGERHVMLIDEANMKLPGEIDFIIKALGSSDKICNYRNNEYVLTDEHLLFLTGNAESLPLRYYHQAIQDFSETIYFEKPDDEFLLNHAASMIKTHLHPYTATLLYAYHLIKEYNPFLTVSIRDIESLTNRFAFLSKHIELTDQNSFKIALLRACTGEFGVAIKPINERHHFSEQLRKKIGLVSTLDEFSLESLIPLTEDIAITRSKSYMIDAILQDFDLRLDALIDHAKHQANQLPLTLFSGKKGKEKIVDDDEFKINFKQAIIVEGDPGLGKSTLLRAIVNNFKQKLEMRKIELEKEIQNLIGDPKQSKKLIALNVIIREINKPIYEISLGSADAKATLTKALHEEALVIADESNMDFSLEELLNQYLSGTDENKKPIIKPGFMFLGSQNSTAEINRPDASWAMRNRTHFIYMDKFTKEEYLAFAKAKDIPYPEQFVKAYQTICASYPYANTRTFHHLLKSEAQSSREKRIQTEFLHSKLHTIEEEKNEDRAPLIRYNPNAYDMV